MTEVVQISDFEANVLWVVGLAREATVDVSTGADPATFVLTVTPVVPAPPARPTTGTPTFTG